MFVFLIQTDEMFTILMPWSERLSRFLTAHQHRLGQTAPFTLVHAGKHATMH